MAGAILSTGKKDYTTPEWIVEAVRRFYRSLPGFEAAPYAGIDLDPCSNPQSLVRATENLMLEPVPSQLLGWQEYDDGVRRFLSTYFTANGLEANWAGLRVYANPPFGYFEKDGVKTSVGNWVNKAIQGSMNLGHAVLCLPDTPDTKVWKNTLLLKAQGRCQLKQRVKFGGMKTAIPKPISLIYFGSRPDLFKEYLREYGRVENPSVVYADQADLVL